MKFHSSVKMMPIIIGIGFSSSNSSHTDFNYSESDIINKKTGFNLNALKSNLYNEFATQNNLFSKLYLESKFSEYYKNWKHQTQFMSNPVKIIENENFQFILELGTPVIPYILKTIKEEPSCLIWALNMITGIKISNSQQISISEACNLWVKWGAKKYI